MINPISAIKLSNQYAKGSIASRIKTSEKLNKDVFQQIIPLFEKRGSCFLSDLKARYESSMPENKLVQVLPIKQSVYFEQSGYVMLNDDVVAADCYILGIESRKKGKKNNIMIKSLPDFVHESTHIFDYLLNPKYLMNLAKMEKLGIYDKQYYKIYDELFYNPNHIGDFGLKNQANILEQAEIETRKALENIPYEEKIIFLNYMKYNMQTEYNAYDQEYKLVEYLRKTRNFASLKKCKNCNDYYHFPEKIEIINKLIKETIQKERAK